MRHEHVSACHGCGQYRLCRQWRRRFWFCFDGPAKCWRRRRDITEVKLYAMRKSA